MQSQSLIALALVAALPLGLAQERVKKKGAADFAAVHQSLGESWKAGQYGKSVDLARELLAIANTKRSAVVMAAMPAAPEGWTVESEEQSAQENAMAAAIAAGMGTTIQRRYSNESGEGSLELTVTADSPLAQMVQMWLTNPQMLGEDAELVKYGTSQAVLRKDGDSWNLQMLIDDDLVEATLYGQSDDFLLGFLDQAAVDKLAAALRS